MNIRSAWGWPTPNTTWVLPCASRHRVQVAASRARSSSVLVAFMSHVLRSGEARHRIREEHAPPDRLGHRLHGHGLDPALVRLHPARSQGEDRVPVPHYML